MCSGKRFSELKGSVTDTCITPKCNTRRACGLWGWLVDLVGPLTKTVTRQRLRQSCLLQVGSLPVQVQVLSRIGIPVVRCARLDARAAQRDTQVFFPSSKKSFSKRGGGRELSHLFDGWRAGNRSVKAVHAARRELRARRSPQLQCRRHHDTMAGESNPRVSQGEAPPSPASRRFVSRYCAAFQARFLLSALRMRLVGASGASPRRRHPIHLRQLVLCIVRVLTRRATLRSLWLLYWSGPERSESALRMFLPVGTWR